MAQLDKLLPHVAARGARALRLEPGQQPVLELPDGEAVPLLPNAIPATMVEVLAREVMSLEAQQSWAMGRETAFSYVCGTSEFEIQLARTASGVRILAQLLETAPVSLPPPTRPVVEVAPRALPEPLPVPIPSSPAPAPAVTSGGGNGLALAHRLFSELLAHKGSDLHVSSFEVPSVRISGDLEELHDFGVLGSTQILEMMKALATPPAWEQFQARNDADFAYAFSEGNCRLRVNFFMDRQGPGLVCRVIPSEIPDPDKLGLPEPIRRLADLAKGLVLVTGPTGSGKSTTLAAILDIANRTRRDHILTIEDPIEFVHPRKGCLVNQREIGTHTESFKSGLRAALREDPDIVMVGEMRDLETISIALETAITGHLVFGTLHTNSAVGTIDRIVDQFPADRQQQIRVMLADSLKACISQTLLKKNGGGRVAALESLFITPAIANLIREGKNFQIASAMQTGRAYGQKLMNESMIELIKAGLVDPAEGYMKCPDKESYMAALKRASIAWDLRGEERGGLV